VRPKRLDLDAALDAARLRLVAGGLVAGPLDEQAIAAASGLGAQISREVLSNWSPPAPLGKRQAASSGSPTGSATSSLDTNALRRTLTSPTAACRQWWLRKVHRYGLCLRRYRICLNMAAVEVAVSQRLARDHHARWQFQRPRTMDPLRAREYSCRVPPAPGSLDSKNREVLPLAASYKRGQWPEQERA
jgi:hypothetical protein